MTELTILPQGEPFVCPECKFLLEDEKMHGWVKDYSKHLDHTGHHRKLGFCLVPCPLCSDFAIAQRKAADVERLLGRAMLPYYAKSWNFGTVPDDVDQAAKAIAAVFATQHRDKRGLYLHGEPGAGKTGLAIAIIQSVMFRGIDAAFIRSIDLINRLREAIARGTHEGDELLHLVKNVRWLALDDLATERPTPYVIEQFYAVIEERRASGLYTVITSNFSLRELEAHWRPQDVRPGAFHAGKRVVDRIAEYCDQIPMKGRNLRRTVPDEGKIKPIRGN